MSFEVDTGFAKGDAFGLKQFALERAVWFPDQEFAARAHHTMPRNALAFRRAGHGEPNRPSTTTNAQGFGDGSIGSNPAARNLFHKAIDRIPGHLETAFSLICAARCSDSKKRIDMVVSASSQRKRIATFRRNACLTL
jgi:hypothetical protein